MQKRTSLISLLFLLLILEACKKDTPVSILNETGTLTDIEGNSYKTVKIGDQWWMAENLKVKTYTDGTSIPFLDSTQTDSVWINQPGATCCSVDSRYGILYNWYHINDSRKIAPQGWHIPTDEEWQKLEKELGMNNGVINNTGWRGTVEAEKIIPKSSIGWPTDALVFGSNTSGFSALPGGCRLFNGKVNHESNTAFWWSSSDMGDEAWYRSIDSKHKTIFRQHTYKKYGFSIRCVKD